MELIYFKRENSGKNSQLQLDGFVIKAGKMAGEYGTEFLQSFCWGEILLAEGGEILRIGIVSDSLNKSEIAKSAFLNPLEINSPVPANKQGSFNQPDQLSGDLLLTATLVKKKLFGKFHYWYAPRGPILNLSLLPENRSQALDFFYKSLKSLTKTAVFLRIEPLFREQPVGFLIKKTHSQQPAKTLVLDLQNSPEKLLAGMHQKTRYNLHLAEKKGVLIQESGEEGLAEFWRLMTLTSARDAFNLHPRQHYQNLLANKSGEIKLFFASYEGKKIAAALVSFWGNKVVYLHGASDNQARNLMAPYLLQWEIIKQAQNQGYRYYDFYGIDEEKWPGVTRFKLGFGGQVVNYPGTKDIIFQPIVYHFYNLLRSLRRLL